MKSKPTGSGEIGLPSQFNSAHDDARGGSFLLAHQQLGALALPTNASNTQTLTLTVNGTAIVITFVSSIGAAANNVLIGASAAATAVNLINFLRRPDITNSTQIAASAPNQALLQFVGWSLPSGGSTITPYSLNKNVNGASSPLTTFTASTTVTGASWTAQTMQLYIEDGVYYVGTTRVIFNGGSTPTFTAPASNPRIDIVTADSSGTIAITQGTESASPVAPSYPTNKVVICEVYNVVGETAIYDTEYQQAGQGYISNDVRQILQPVYIGSASQVATQLFIPWIASPAQGDIAYYNGSAWARLPAGTSGYTLQTLGAGANPQWGLPNALAVLDDENIPSGASAFTTATFTARNYLRVVIVLQTQSATTSSTNIVFNGDTSAHYALRSSTNGAADILTTSQSVLNPQIPSNASIAIVVLEITNISGAQKIVTGTISQAASTVGTAPGRVSFSGVWNSTAAQITSITVGSGGSNGFATNDRIIVYGN